VAHTASDSSVRPQGADPPRRRACPHQPGGLGARYPRVHRTRDNDIKAHGEYRTKNLILAEYDRMAAVGLTLENPFVEGESGTYRSTLTPPLATAPDTAPDSRNLAPVRDSAGPATVPGPALQELGVT
jgi:hypothetical protein